MNRTLGVSRTTASPGAWAGPAPAWIRIGVGDSDRGRRPALSLSLVLSLSLSLSRSLSLSLSLTRIGADNTMSAGKRMFPRLWTYLGNSLSPRLFPQPVDPLPCLWT
jgi:hypothetical protein